MADSGERWSPLTRTVVASLCLWALAATLARALRWPNDFAEAHWLLDYRFGFVKRGLAGQVLSSALSLVGLEPTEAIIAGLAACLLSACCVVLLWLAWQIIRAADWSPASVLVALTFLSSPFVVMAAHLNGYYDNVILMLTVAAIALVVRGRTWPAAVVMTAAVLVHESAIVIGFPSLMVAWWLARQGSPAPAAGTPRFWPLMFPLVAFGALAISTSMLPPGFQDAYSNYLAGFTFVRGDMHLLVPEWLTPGFLDQIATHRFAERIAFAEMYGLVLPTTMALLAYVVDAYGIRVRSVTMWAMLAAVMAPQVMHLAAWDTTRIWTYSIVASYLVAWTVVRASGRPKPVSTVVAWLSVVAVVVNVMAMTPLLDNLVDRYRLTTRLLMYLPVLAMSLWLLWHQDRS